MLQMFQTVSQWQLLPGVELGNSTVKVLAKDGGFPREIRDPVKRHIILAQPPQRIVSGILAGDEMLTELVSLDRIASITYLADDPGISNVPNYYPGSLPRNHGTIEEYLSLQADLAIVAAYSNATSVEMLLSTGIPVIRFANFHSYQDIRNNLTTLAKALGTEVQAQRWLLEMDSRIAEIHEKVASEARPRVLYYSLSGSTSGPGSLMDETINLAGGINVIAETGLRAYSRISPEMAIALQPEVILLSDWNNKAGQSARDILLNNPAWQDVPAIRSQRVYSLRGAWLTSGSPHRIKGVEEVARLLHPQRFSGDKG